LVGNEMDGNEGKENGKVRNSGRENIAPCDRSLSFLYRSWGGLMLCGLS
jgi:hypothetical protein